MAYMDRTTAAASLATIKGLALGVPGYDDKYTRDLNLFTA